MTDTRIRVLVVDDSDVARMLLVQLLSSDPRLRVIGALGDGQAAITFVNDSKPDVIVMDIHMPGMDGFEATRRIMETNPVPIVICSGTRNPREVAITFRLMEAGAVACIEKPPGHGHPDHDAMVLNLLQTVTLMSEVKVVRRWPRSRPVGPPGSPAPRTPAGRVRVVGIGASTGGPPVLQTILAGLPKEFPAPILVVQHIAAGFLPGLAEWLNQTTGFQVQIAALGTAPLPGHVYLAPDDFHMGIAPGGRLLLSREEPENGLRPAVSFLFRSMANVWGAGAVGVLLTGMGKDGAAELKRLKDLGAPTIVQDRESSVVHGMPGEAIALGAAAQVLAPDRMPGAILKLVNGTQETGDPT